MKKMKLKIVCLLVALLCIPCYGQIAKSVVLDDWELIAQNAVRKGAEQNITTWQSTTLHIACGVTAATAHTGTKVSVQVSGVDSGDDAWYTLTEFIGPTGTATPTTLTTIPNAGSSTILVPLLGIGTWGRFDDDGIRPIFVLGSPTVANSEIHTLVSHTVGAASSVTILDGLANLPGTSTVIWDLAETYIVELPKHNNRVRVVYDNTNDSDGSTVYMRTSIYGVRE
ncbi:hypothetical protein LCGC14_2694330 [marine sediment metagenome]|uniref:Uncharacterized protein n=1 Tax=marine sediment metagenome TaxID=412755 RepID=A0A0F8ZHN2_9ZZZZ